MSLRDDILVADDRPFEDVYVPQWNRTVRIRGLTAADSERFAKKVGPDGDKDVLYTTELVVRCAEDPETGARLFRPEDTDALAEKSGAAMGRLFSVAQRLSGLGDLDDAKKDSAGEAAAS